MQTLTQLFLRSEPGESLDAERKQRLEQALVQDHQSDMPWYLRFIVGAGAWLASLFFIGFFIVLVGWQDEHRATIGAIGAVLLVTAIILFRLKFGLFVSQCCLACSLAGQFMLYYGFLPDQHDTLQDAALLAIGLAAILYALYPDSLHRLITCLAALHITLAWLYLGDNGDLFDSPGAATGRPLFALFLYWAFHFIGIAVCLMPVHRRSALLSPLGYAFVLSLAAWQLEGLWPLWPPIRAEGPVPLFIFWPACAFVAVLAVVTWAAGGFPAWRKYPIPFAGMVFALAIILWLGAGGILSALFLIVLGFFIESRIIQAIGLILLATFLSHYYYSLRLDLMIKALALVGSGLTLLVMRTGLQRWFDPQTLEVT